MKNLHNDIRNLTNQYKFTRDYTLELVKDLTPEDMNIQSEPFVSPTKWHLAHTTWFFEKFILEKFKDKFKPFNETFNFLFNSYYHSVGLQVPQKRRGQMSRPSIKEILKYRKYVDEQIKEIFETHHSKDNNFIHFLNIGINHEQQHQELMLMDILNVFFHNPLKPKFTKTERKFKVIKENQNEWVKNTKSVKFKIGNESHNFCFDNELPLHKTIIKPFEINKKLVNNFEWKEFIYNDGYERPELWLSDGFEFIKKTL